MKGLRDRDLLGLLVGCGLRRGELAALGFDAIAQREGRWAIAMDLRHDNPCERLLGADPGSMRPRPLAASALASTYAPLGDIPRHFLLTNSLSMRYGFPSSLRVFETLLRSLYVWRFAGPSFDWCHLSAREAKAVTCPPGPRRPSPHVPCSKVKSSPHSGLPSHRLREVPEC